MPVTHEHRVDALVAQLGQDRELALVFVRTKRGADRLVKRLGASRVSAVAMHGNKSQRQRERALADFQSGRVDVLVATDVAARGIDVDGISHVINFDPPHDSETYVHRIGRTARAGATGTGITLLSPDQHHEMTRLAGQLGLTHALDAPRPRPHAPAPALDAPRPRPHAPAPAPQHGTGRRPNTRRRSRRAASRA